MICLRTMSRSRATSSNRTQYVTKNGEVSPTFYTTTDSEGRFSFDLSEKVTYEIDAQLFWLAAGGVRVRV